MYGTFKDLSNCLYIDLDSESSDQMLYKCSDAISKNINKSLEKKPSIEGFSEKCCPDGTTDVNGSCVEVCNNCDYNDCDVGSLNIGNFYKYPNDKKETKNRIIDEDMYNYIVMDVPDN